MFEQFKRHNLTSVRTLERSNSGHERSNVRTESLVVLLAVARPGLAQPQVGRPKNAQWPVLGPEYSLRRPGSRNASSKPWATRALSAGVVASGGAATIHFESVPYNGRRGPRHVWLLCLGQPVHTLYPHEYFSILKRLSRSFVLAPLPRPGAPK